jgi:hypothetical protein
MKIKTIKKYLKPGESPHNLKLMAEMADWLDSVAGSAELWARQSREDHEKLRGAQQRIPEIKKTHRAHWEAKAQRVISELEREKQQWQQ